MTTPNPMTPQPGEGAAARNARIRQQHDTARRDREDQVLAEADRLGDTAPALIREAAADIRDHRQMETRRGEWATQDAAQAHVAAVEPLALVAPPWRLAAPEAVDFASRVRQVHPDADVREAAQRLLDRYDTITGLAAYSRGVVDPDKLHHVLEDMRHLADQVTADTLSETDAADTYTATQDAVTPVRADERYAEEFQNHADQLADTGFADQWYRMGIAARDAAEWANAGFTPSEAEEQIAQGRTPRQILEAEAAEFHTTDAERVGAEHSPSDPAPAEADQYGAEVKRLIARRDAALAKFWEHLDEFQRQHTEAELTADRYAAERARIEQAATTAAAELRAQADLDRITDQVDRHHGDGEAPFRAEPVAEDVQEVGR